MNRTLSVWTLAAVCLMGVSAFLPACGDSPSSPSPSNSVANPSPASPSPPNQSPPSQPTSPTYTVSGIVTDVVRHAGIAGAYVELQGGNVNYVTVTDKTGTYSIPGLSLGFYRVRAGTGGYDASEHVVEVLLAGVRVDFELRPLVPPSANYAGVWTGVYRITDCRDLDVPGLTQFHLCPQSSQSYEFTLTQIGTLVSGTYTMKSEFYMCACGLMYGELPMSGSISPDGTLAITALGSGHGTVGATVELDLVLRQASSSTIIGTGTIHLRYYTPDDRSIGSVVIQSGTRAQ